MRSNEDRKEKKVDSIIDHLMTRKKEEEAQLDELLG
jgi:hypothetical protein